MHFSASTLLLLGSLVQANAMANRVIGRNDQSKEPSIVKSQSNALADGGDFYFGGVLTSFSVVEGTGCPAGTFTPQSVEAGKSLNAFVDFDSFVYNSTTSEGPVTCTLKFDFEYTYPEGDGTPVLLAQVSTDLSSEYEENDQERGTNFNLEHTFTFKAGDSEIDNVGLIWTVVKDGPVNSQTGAALYVSGTPGEKGVGSFQLDYNMYTSFGPGEMKVTRTTLGFGVYQQER